MRKRGRPKESVPGEQANRLRDACREAISRYGTTQVKIAEEPGTAHKLYGDDDGSNDPVKWFDNALNSQALTAANAELLYDVIVESEVAFQWRVNNPSERDPFFDAGFDLLPWRYTVPDEMPMVLVPDSEVSAFAKELTNAIRAAQLRISDKRLRGIETALASYLNANSDNLGWNLIWDLGWKMNARAEKYRNGTIRRRSLPDISVGELSTALEPHELLNECVWIHYRDRLRDQERIRGRDRIVPRRTLRRRKQRKQTTSTARKRP